MINATADEFPAVDFDYTHNGGGAGFVGVNQTVVGLLTLTNLLSLIILIALVGIILAIVFNVIPGARVESGV